MKIKVYTLPACPICPLAKKIAAQVAQKYNISYHEVDLTTIEGKEESLKYQIMSVPTIIINDDVVSQGKMISQEDLEREVKKRLGMP
jgi:glutaredoxin